VTKKSTPPSSSVIGYLRVSTADQSIEKNKADILQLANNHDLGRVRFVEEKISGKVSWRERKLAEVLGSLQANDAIIVSELSRLGRSMLECMEILSVAAQKRINVYSVKGAWRLDQSIQSKIIAMAFSMAAEIERDLISQRTKEALRFKKSQGMILGRPTGPGKSKTRSLSSRDREPAGKWFHPKVCRLSLPHDRGQSPQLAQKARIEIILRFTEYHATTRHSIRMKVAVTRRH
jgi:DNA invertase Pin-like site-specific DNA recombinase